VSQAQETSIAELDSQSTVNIEGDVETLVLPTLHAGDKIWISNPVFKIHGQYKIYSLTHKFPRERTLCTVHKERKSKQLMKKRIDKENMLQSITNPYGMTDSFNFTFDDNSNIASKDSNVNISNGVINLASGTQGTFTSTTLIASGNITEIHLKSIGTNITTSNFRVSTNGGATYQDLILEGRIVLNNPSAQIILKVTLQSATAELDSLALLYR
jgi:hypothetical protein